jgi:hypothetical protein
MLSERLAQIRGSWFPCLRSSLDRHALLSAIDDALPSTTHNILWNVDGHKWFDEGHAVAIYEAIATATDLQHCRDVGRDAARYAMVSTWRDMMQPLVGLIGGTPRLAFEQMPVLWNATRRDAGEVVCVESSPRHAVTELRHFPYATSQAWAHVWLGHHDALLRQLRFAGRADLEILVAEPAEPQPPPTVRTRVAWGAALTGTPTTFGDP